MATETIEATPKRNPWRPYDWTEEKINALADDLDKWAANEENYYADAFLCEAQITRQQADDFGKRNEKFKESFARARLLSERRIVHNSLTRRFDGNFARFVLQNRNGWREKQEVTLDAQGPLLQLLASVDGHSKAIIEEAQIVQDAITAQEPINRP